MKRALIGKKLGMTQVFAEDGTLYPATMVQLGPCVVLQKKTKEKDGYAALKIGFGDAKEKHVTKPILSDFKKRGVAPKSILREIEVFDDSIEVGGVLTCEIFNENDLVQVTGVSKGKGFQGVIKRYGFAGGRASHGSNFHRAPGSIGANTFPAEVWKGKKMPGRMGNDQVTVKNLKILKVLKDQNIVLISGAIPGTKNSVVIVKEK